MGVGGRVSDFKPVAFQSRSPPIPSLVTPLWPPPPLSSSPPPSPLTTARLHSPEGEVCSHDISSSSSGIRTCYSPAMHVAALSRGLLLPTGPTSTFFSSVPRK